MNTPTPSVKKKIKAFEKTSVNTSLDDADRKELTFLRLRVAVAAVVRGNFEECSAQFLAAEGQQDTWDVLSEAMWALQGLSDHRKLDALMDVGVGNWISTLATWHKFGHPSIATPASKKE